MQTQRNTEFKITAPVKREIIKIIDERVKEAHVTKEDFSELKGIVKDISIKLAEIADVQKKTEQRVEELADAQKKTEQRVEELADAQKKTEQRVEELADAQKETQKEVTRLDIAMKELADAQKKTEQSLNRRADKIEERLEGLSNTFGYSLENSAYRQLPSLLKKDGIEVQGHIIRRYYERKGQYNQINIFARITKRGKNMLMLGEVKTRPSKIEIDKFIKIAEHIKKTEGNPEVYLVFVAHDYHPNTERYLKDKGIKYFWSYEMD